jgi:hypothetical protein
MIPEPERATVEMHERTAKKDRRVAKANAVDVRYSDGRYSLLNAAVTTSSLAGGVPLTATELLKVGRLGRDGENYRQVRLLAWHGLLDAYSYGDRRRLRYAINPRGLETLRFWGSRPVNRVQYVHGWQRNTDDMRITVTRPPSQSRWSLVDRGYVLRRDGWHYDATARAARAALRDSHGRWVSTPTFQTDPGFVNPVPPVVVKDLPAWTEEFLPPCLTCGAYWRCEHR